MAAGPAGDLPLELPGRVIDQNAEPVPNALVVIIESTVPMPELAIQTDDAGRFALRLPEGRFTLRAHAPDGRAGDVSVKLPGHREIRVAIRDDS